MRDAAILSIAPKADVQRKKTVYMAKRRIKMAECLYCNGGEDDFSSQPVFQDEIETPFSSYMFEIGVLQYQKDFMLDVCVGEYQKGVMINYCPMCGRKLREAADDPVDNNPGI